MRQYRSEAVFSMAALCIAILLSGCVKDASFELGKAAPEISVIDLKDQPVKLSDYRGKVIVLRFWSGRCKACVAEMPAIDEYGSRLRGRGLVILAVNRGDTKEEVETFVETMRLSHPVLLDPALIASAKYRVASVPTTFFIDRKGTAVKRIEGAMKQEQFEKTVEELL